MASLDTETYKLRGKARAAFWGAAVGDALGWPQEMPSRRVKTHQGANSNRGALLMEWRRRSGGRFMPHEETILAGEYSDDTQLMLCCARSLLFGSEWLKHFAQDELPGWAVYQRGGGGATKRAVEMWVRGVPPWSGESEDVNRYLEAGGNGVAMRILPHALYGADDDRFDKTARAIFLNGICTHGHPRALLGALCYGYVAWEAFRHVGTLPYGRLLKRAVDNFTLWSSIPQRTGLVSIWMESADRLNTGTFDLRWKEIAAEFLALLEKAVAGINSGALSIDSEVLSTLGCFDKSRNGAGTVCAAAAVYLASKYAPDPQHGILEAAFAPGADTDTLASMTGGLLGIIAGTDWLLQSRDSLQDERYLGEIADRLCETERSATIDEEIVTALPHHRNAREAILRDLVDGSVGATVLLPDGRRARVQHLDTLKSASAISAQQWHLTADDGQTLYIKKVGRIPKNSGDEDRSVPNKRISGKRSVRISSKVQALKLSVEDLNKSRSFYGGLLGLRVTRESKNAVNFGGVITLVNSDYLRDIDVCHPGLCSFRSIVCIETKDIELCYRRVSEDTSTRVGSFSELAGRRMFRCLDPDKNVVEVFEAPPKKSTSGLVVNS